MFVNLEKQRISSRPNIVRVFGPLCSEDKKFCCILCTKFRSPTEFITIVIHIENPVLNDRGQVKSYDKKLAWIGTPITDNLNNFTHISWEEVPNIL